MENLTKKEPKKQSKKVENKKENAKTNQTMNLNKTIENQEMKQTETGKQNTQNKETKQNEKKKENSENCDHNSVLLNTIYHICNLSINSIEDVITMSKNTAFQNAITDIHSRYEVISKECGLLSKAMNISLTQVDCITKFKNWATVRIDALFDCSTQNLAKILYGGTACEIAELIVKQTNCNSANADIISLAEKLENLQEHHIHDLKKYLSIRE